MLRIVTIGEMSENKDNWEGALPKGDYPKTFVRNCFFTVFAFTALSALLAFGVLWCFTIVALIFNVIMMVPTVKLAQIIGMKKPKVMALLIPGNIAVFAVFFVIRMVVVGVFKSKGLI